MRRQRHGAAGERHRMKDAVFHACASTTHLGSLDPLFACNPLCPCAAQSCCHTSNVHRLFCNTTVKRFLLGIMGIASEGKRGRVGAAFHCCGITCRTGPPCCFSIGGGKLEFNGHVPVAHLWAVSRAAGFTGTAGREPPPPPSPPPAPQRSVAEDARPHPLAARLVRFIPQRHSLARLVCGVSARTQPYPGQTGRARAGWGRPARFSGRSPASQAACSSWARAGLPQGPAADGGGGTMATGGAEGPHVLQPMPAPSHAAISSNNMATLLITKADLEAAVPVLAALQGGLSTQEQRNMRCTPLPPAACHHHYHLPPCLAFDVQNTVVRSL